MLDIATIIFGLAMIYVIVANSRPVLRQPDLQMESMESFLERTAADYAENPNTKGGLRCHSPNER